MNPVTVAKKTELINALLAADIPDADSAGEFYYLDYKFMRAEDRYYSRGRDLSANFVLNPNEGGVRTKAIANQSGGAELLLPEGGRFHW